MYMCTHTHAHTCAHTHNGILCSHQKTQNLAICNNMDGTRGYYAKQNKLIRERQLSYDLPDMRNLRGRTRDPGEKGGEKNETRWDWGGRQIIGDS